jgi:hypothetical protein
MEIEALERPREIFWCEARPGIADDDPARARGDDDAPADGCEA